MKCMGKRFEYRLQRLCLGSICEQRADFRPIALGPSLSIWIRRKIPDDTVHARYYDAPRTQQGCRLSCFHKAVHYTHTFNSSTGGLLNQVNRQFYLCVYQQAIFLHQKYLPQALRRQLTQPRSFCRSHLQEKRHTPFP